MAFDDDSLLFRPPAFEPASARAWFESLGFTVRVADLAFERLRSLLLDISLKAQGPPPSQTRLDLLARAAAVSDAWTLIDTFHRFHKLINACPRNMKKGPDLKADIGAYEALMTPIEEMRNAVQHLDREIDKLAVSGHPVAGYLAFVYSPEPGVCFSSVLVGGGAAQQSHDFVNPLGMEIRSPIDHIRLHAHGFVAHLSTEHRRMLDIAARLEKTLREHFAGAGRVPPPMMLTFGVSVDVPRRDGG